MDNLREWLRKSWIKRKGKMIRFLFGEVEKETAEESLALEGGLKFSKMKEI